MHRRCFLFLFFFSGIASAQRSETLRVFEGVLIGTVMAPSGNPIAGAVVEALPVDLPKVSADQQKRQSRRPLLVRTDRNGTFHLPLDFGQYHAQVSAPGFLSVMYENTVDSADAVPIVLTSENAEAVWAVVLTPISTLSGQLTDNETILDDDSGRPVASARISAQRLNLAGVWQTATDGDGAFEMSGLPNGDFLVRVEKRGFVGEFFDDARKSENAKSIGVDADDPITDLRISLAHRQPADFDGNGVVDFADLMVLLQNLVGKRKVALSFDINQDNQVDFLDFLAFVQVMQRAGKVVARQGTLSVEQVKSESGELIAAFVANFPESVEGYAVRVTYDPDETDYAGVETDSKSGKVLVYKDFGAVVIAGDYREGPHVTGLRTIARLKFVPKNEKVVLTPEIGLGVGREGKFMSLQLPGQIHLESPPQTFRLLQNVPNPFNPATAIDFELPEGANVELAIYNLVGQRVRTLVKEFRPAGRYQVAWDAKDDLGRDVSSGVYFYRFQAGHFGATRRMLLVR